MIERISEGPSLLALIIRADYHGEGIEFFTPDNFSQQLAYMNRPPGYRVQPHVHNAVKREVFYTQEVLLLRSGKVKVDFYGNDREFVDTRVLGPGDVILLASGGHGFEMLEASELIEIKQGPFAGERDKERFEPRQGGGGR